MHTIATNWAWILNGACMRLNPSSNKEAEKVEKEAHQETKWALILGVKKRGTEEEEAEEGVFINFYIFFYKKI